MAEPVSLIAAFVAGIVSFLSPCVLPLVPGYLSYVSGMTLDEMSAGDRSARADRVVLTNTLFFVLGFTLVFVSLGATASSLGSLLLQNQRWLERVAGALVVVFGLHMMGLLKISWLYREKRFHGPDRTRGPLGATLLGVAFAAGWTPCIGPILAGILALAATRDSLAQGVVLLVVYSAGLGIPFLLTGWATQRFLGVFQHVKRHMRAIEVVGGLMLVAIGVMIFTSNFFLFQSWLSFLNRFAL